MSCSSWKPVGFTLMSSIYAVDSIACRKHKNIATEPSFFTPCSIWDTPLLVIRTVKGHEKERASMWPELDPQGGRSAPVCRGRAPANCDTFGHQLPQAPQSSITIFHLAMSSPPSIHEGEPPASPSGFEEQALRSMYVDTFRGISRR